MMNCNTAYLIAKRFALKKRIKILKTNIRQIEIMEYEIHEENYKVMKVLRKIYLCQIQIDEIDEKIEMDAGIKDGSYYKTSQILDMTQVHF